MSFKGDRCPYFSHFSRTCENSIMADWEPWACGWTTSLPKMHPNSRPCPPLPTPPPTQPCLELAMQNPFGFSHRPWCSCPTTHLFSLFHFAGKAHATLLGWATLTHL